MVHFYLSPPPIGLCDGLVRGLLFWARHKPNFSYIFYLTLVNLLIFKEINNYHLKHGFRYFIYPSRLTCPIFSLFKVGTLIAYINP